MLVSQIGATICILCAVVAFSSSQFVNHDAPLNWLDRLGMAAVAGTSISGAGTILALIWGL